ncbi:hypothetical protein GALL_489410 [mine drainage metagenome]|uniref:Uncharacterized protein n=1 Tax=mine drainage metagenome TaxID=410659 RepID=A0A1J5PVY0_9ZZZZ
MLLLVALDQALELLQPFLLARVADALHEAVDAAVVHRLGAGQLHRGDGLAGGALDGAQQMALARGDEQDGVAAASGPAGAADAVDIAFGVGRNVVVHHVADAFHVQAACGHVGGHQDVELPVLEALHHPLAQRLRHIAVERGDGEAAGGQLFRQLFRGLLGAGENDHALEGLDFQDAGERIEFVQAAHRPIALAHIGRRGGACLDGDFFRAAQIGLRNAPDDRRHGGREQRDLAFGRGLFQDGFDIVDKSHAQHFVGFVQHQVRQLVELERAALQMVDDAARCAHHHVHAAPECVELRHIALAAVDRQHMQSGQMGGVTGEGLGDLNGEFARGREHQRLYFGAVQVDARQDGEGESRRLAGAGLRLPQHVASGEQGRNGGGLDGRRRLVAHVAQRLKQRGGQAEIGEGGCVGRGHE